MNGRTLTADELLAFLRPDVIAAQKQKKQDGLQRQPKSARSSGPALHVTAKKKARQHRKPAPHTARSAKPTLRKSKLIVDKSRVATDADILSKPTWDVSLRRNEDIVKLRVPRAVVPKADAPPMLYLQNPQSKLEKGGGYTPSFQLQLIKKIRAARKRRDFEYIAQLRSSKPPKPIPRDKTQRSYTTVPTAYTASINTDVPIHVSSSQSRAKDERGPIEQYHLTETRIDLEEQEAVKLSIVYDDETRYTLGKYAPYPFPLPTLEAPPEPDDAPPSKVESINDLYSNPSPSNRDAPVKPRSYKSSDGKYNSRSMKSTKADTRKQSGAPPDDDEFAQLESQAAKQFGF